MKFIIADDHVLFRDTLEAYLKRDMPDCQVFFFRDFYGVHKALKEGLIVDLVILDYHMAGMNNGGALDIIKYEFPAQRVALISGVAEPAQIRIAMQKGAVAYFPKTMHGKHLMDGMRRTAKGEKFFPVDDTTHELLPSYYADKSPLADSEQTTQAQLRTMQDIGLSKTETKVLAALLKGAQNKQIAQANGVKEVTIKMHVTNICKKLGVKNRTQAAIKARDLGFESA